MEKTRVVITGIGIVSPLGIGKLQFWDSLKQNRCNIDKITYFEVDNYPCKIASCVKDFNPLDFLDKKLAHRTDRFTQFALAAAKLAIEDANLDILNEDKERIGAYVGSGIGGLSTIEKELYVLLNKGPRRVSAFLIPMLIINAASGEIAIKYQLQGPNSASVTACASSAHAIGDAFNIIKRNQADVMLAGGAEACITPLALAGFCSMRALSTHFNDTPKMASRPFDKKRDGFVMGEGAAILILEELNHARRRNAHIYAEIIGYGMSADGYHIVAPHPEGEGAVKAMQRALAEAGIDPKEVDYINSHGTSTKLNDSSETLAIKKVFKEHAYKIPINSTKSMLGHLLGAAGAAELVASILALEEDFIHATINYEYKDEECDLWYVPNEPIHRKVKICLSNSLGFGGQNATLIIKKL
jgi:3-oxoacyl-[acyl-carrier-protein] synthase II